MGNLTPLRAAAPPCKCAVAGYLGTLDHEDTATLLDWLNDETIRASVISAHLRTQAPPVTVGADSIRRWRRHECGCQHG